MRLPVIIINDCWEYIIEVDLAAVVCVCVSVCAQNLTNFCPHALISTPNVPNFFSAYVATFPSATFGPLFAFHCPLFVTKNNNLDGNHHASPHAGTGATFTGRVFVRALENRH